MMKSFDLFRVFVSLALLALIVSACAAPTAAPAVETVLPPTATAAPTAIPQPPNYFVDSAVSASGDGLSAATAFKTIKEALQSPLEPGSVVAIAAGTYPETMYVNQSGAEVVPMTTNVKVAGADKIQFPAGVDLSGVDVANHPGQYFLYLAHSWSGNSGVYEITSVDSANGVVTVSGADFQPEAGAKDDLTLLSAGVGRPIQIRNADPAKGEVVVDVSADPNSCTVLYIGDGWIEPCAADNPIAYVLVDGLTLTGSNTCGGVHIQSGSFITIANANINSMWGAAGILVNGNEKQPALYNYIIGNTIYDTTSEAIYIGAGDQGEACNYTQFTHVLNNDISHSEGAWLENAIEVKEFHNTGTVIAGNLIHDFPLNNFWNGAINLQWGADETLVYANTLRDVTPAYEEEPLYVMGIEAIDTYPTRNISVFNNLIYNTETPSATMYAMAVRGDNTENVNIYNNTVSNTTGGLYLHCDTGDGSNNGVTIQDNIFNLAAGSPVITEADWSTAFGSFTIQNNLFSSDPGGEYAVPAAWIGDPLFTPEFSLQTGSPALNRALGGFPAQSSDLGWWGAK
jgi:hypothetical protein